MSATTASDARAIATRYLAERYGGNQDVSVTSVRELDIGWLVLYQSASYIASGHEHHALLGNSPLVVDRDGRVHLTGTALPVSEYVAAIRKRLSE